MKRMKKKLVVLVGIVAFLAIGASASAELQEAAYLYGSGASSGDSFGECATNTNIYVIGISSIKHINQTVCTARSYNHRTWGYSTGGDCTQATVQRSTLRTDNTIYAYGDLKQPTGQYSIARATVSAKINGSGSCQNVNFTGYSIGLNR